MTELRLYSPNPLSALQFGPLADWPIVFSPLTMSTKKHTETLVREVGPLAALVCYS
jgi:hypothetical protein